MSNAVIETKFSEFITDCLFKVPEHSIKCKRSDGSTTTWISPYGLQIDRYLSHLHPNCTITMYKRDTKIVIDITDQFNNLIETHSYKIS
jgi:hypothetical protein